MSRPTSARIDFAALRENLRTIRRQVSAARVWAVIKANGYGHGLIPVARALSEADGLAVSSLEEALLLREAGIHMPILLLEGLFEGDEIHAAYEAKLELVVHAEATLALLESTPLLWPRLWIKIDTGMNRLGFRMHEFPDAYGRIRCLSATAPGLMTHLASADQLRNPAVEEQLASFERVTRGHPGPRSLANSAAILQYPECHADWVRPGLLLFGVSPIPGQLVESMGLRPVMTFATAIMAVKRVRKGDRVGYGGVFEALQDGWIGIAAVGYGDGYPYHAPSGTPVWVGGRIVPLAGRVSMDMIAVDLGADPVSVGDPAILWGRELPVETVARHAGTIPYELLCGVAQRVRHDWVDVPEENANHAETVDRLSL
ncbi:MAG: alanine racemase [Gammaproteobacteria bacterium]